MNSPAESDFLKLPLEIRRLVYSHVFEKEYIILPFPQECRYGRGNVPRPKRNIFYHPAAGNLRVYGINSAVLQWIVHLDSSPDFIAIRFDYDSPCGSRYVDDGFQSVFPLGETCQQLYAEVQDFIFAERATFAFADFRSLIIWLKRTDQGLLARVRTIKLEMHVRVDTPREEQELTDINHVVEADEPWFDGLQLAVRRLTGLRAFSLHAELCGPAIAPTEVFGPFRRIPRISEAMQAAFIGAAWRVIDVSRRLGFGDQDKKHGLEARHVVIKSVQRIVGGVSLRSPPEEWSCRGRTCELGADIDRELAALEILSRHEMDARNASQSSIERIQ